MSFTVHTQEPDGPVVSLPDEHKNDYQNALRRKLKDWAEWREIVNSVLAQGGTMEDVPSIESYIIHNDRPTENPKILLAYCASGDNITPLKKNTFLHYGIPRIKNASPVESPSSPRTPTSPAESVLHRSQSASRLPRASMHSNPDSSNASPDYTMQNPGPRQQQSPPPPTPLPPHPVPVYSSFPAQSYSNSAIMNRHPPADYMDLPTQQYHQQQQQQDNSAITHHNNHFTDQPKGRNRLRRYDAGDDGSRVRPSSYEEDNYRLRQTPGLRRENSFTQRSSGLYPEGNPYNTGSPYQ